VGLRFPSVAASCRSNCCSECSEAAAFRHAACPATEPVIHRGIKLQKPLSQHCISANEREDNGPITKMACLRALPLDLPLENSFPMSQKDRDTPDAKGDLPAGKKPGRKKPGSRQFTIPEPDADSQPPPVDDELLRALVRQELNPDETRQVFRLVHWFSQWREAHARILIEESRKEAARK
jgi:hypothetical protein